MGFRKIQSSGVKIKMICDKINSLIMEKQFSLGVSKNPQQIKLFLIDRVSISIDL